MAEILDLVDIDRLRKEVQIKYREVADEPGGAYHFHTGRSHAIRLATRPRFWSSFPKRPVRPSPEWQIPFIGRRRGRASEWSTSVRVVAWIRSWRRFALGRRDESSG